MLTLRSRKKSLSPQAAPETLTVHLYLPQIDNRVVMEHNLFNFQLSAYILRLQIFQSHLAVDRLINPTIVREGGFFARFNLDIPVQFYVGDVRSDEIEEFDISIDQLHWFVVIVQHGV